MCGSVNGNRYGFRKGDQYLYGNCLPNHWYRCTSINAIAIDRCVCPIGHCVDNGQPGLDYCGARRKPEKFFLN
jgi:hypothetical protein